MFDSSTLEKWVRPLRHAVRLGPFIYTLDLCVVKLQRLVITGALPCSKEEAASLAAIQLRLQECLPKCRNLSQNPHQSGSFGLNQVFRMQSVVVSQSAFLLRRILSHFAMSCIIYRLVDSAKSSKKKKLLAFKRRL